MGLQLEYINFINETCALAGFQRATGLKMCELGNQQIRKSAARITKAKTGKEYFSSLGYDHTSIDRNGLDGALPLDLCEPIHIRKPRRSSDLRRCSNNKSQNRQGVLQ